MLVSEDMPGTYHVDRAWLHRWLREAAALGIFRRNNYVEDRDTAIHTSASVILDRIDAEWEACNAG